MKLPSWKAAARRTLFLSLSIGALCAPATAHTAERANSIGFFCIPDFANGYTVGRSGKWEPTQFNVKGRKYLLRLRNSRWVWSLFGEDPREDKSSCNAFNELGFLRCIADGDEILFNRNSLRFQVISPYGYVTSDAGAADKVAITPYIEIGTCTVL